MKKIKIIPLIIISFIYLFISFIFNFSLYHLSKDNNNHQFYMITIYFFGEIISFGLFLLPFKKENLVNYKLSPINFSRNNSNNNSSLSGDDTLNMESEFENNDFTDIENAGFFNLEQPFIGIKLISFLIPGLLDFFSKFLIINGINILTTDSIFRPTFFMIFTIIFSIFFLKINYDLYSKIGYLLIISSLIFSGIYFQCFDSIKDLYLQSNIILGLSFFIIGELLSSFQYTLQAKYFMIGDIHFFKVVAFEGLTGFILSIILLLFAININCPFSSNNQLYSIFCNGKHIESDLFKVMHDIKNNKKISWIIIYFLSPIFYSLFGSLLIKYNGIISRVGIECSGISFWIFILAIINNNDYSLMSNIICFLCVGLSIGGMVICSELGGYSINKVELDYERNNNNEIT